MGMVPLTEGPSPTRTRTPPTAEFSNILQAFFFVDFLFAKKLLTKIEGTEKLCKKLMFKKLLIKRGNNILVIEKEN